MNRLRVRFSRGESIKFISHLDLIRVWHRAFRRAGIELAYSEGFNPHPRISVAVPLALGVTSSAELMDVFLVQPLSSHVFCCKLEPHLPFGLGIMQAFVVPLDEPTLQSKIRFAEYAVRVSIPSETPIYEEVGALLAKDTIPWEHMRDTGLKSYDLRALIDSLWIESVSDGVCTLGMRLRNDASGAGRPEQVAKALRLESPLSIHRTRLVL